MARVRGEVGIIVIGVLIALAAQQVVEDLDWRQKVRIAQETAGEELNDLLGQSCEATQLGRCTTGWIDAAESAIKRRDSAALQTLYDAHPPFSPRNWRSTAWQTIMSTQVADHLDKSYLSRQAFLFSSFEDIRPMVPLMLDARAEVLSGRLGFPDASAQRVGLVAAERLRSQLELYADIAQTVQQQAKSQAVMPPAFLRKIASSLAACRAAVAKASQV